VPRCNFDITDAQDAQIQEIANRGLTRSQVGQIALKAGLSKADEVTRDGIVDVIVKHLPSDDSESINRPGAKRRS
jgi:hypothetical protein